MVNYLDQVDNKRVQMLDPGVVDTMAGSEEPHFLQSFLSLNNSMALRGPK